MNVTVLGCAGWIPGAEQTSCFLIEDQSNLILLDAGTGAANLAQHRELLKKYDTLTILFSHYHLDHLNGLIYLLPYLKGKTLRLMGPGKLAYAQTTSEFLHDLIRFPFFSRPLDRFADQVIIEDFPSEHFQIGQTDIKLRPQVHSAPSYEITVNDRLIYATDTKFNPEDWKGRPGKVLLHECWDICDNPAKPHSSLEGLMDGLKDSPCEKILLIHKNPEWSESDLQTIEQRIAGTRIELAHDGMSFEV